MTPLHVRELILEIERYLEAVALYRELGCQPTWRSESSELPVGRSFDRTLKFELSGDPIV